MNGIGLPPLALALFATVLTLASGDAETLKTYPQGFEMRSLPRTWMCCTQLTSLDGIADSDQVLQAFANGKNDQKQSITLSPASFTVVIGIVGLEHCRYAPDVTSENVLTSPHVIMQKGTVSEYFAKKAKDKSPASLKEAYKALRLAIIEEGGEVKSLVYWRMMIVEVTHDNQVYVGMSHRL